MEIVDLNDVRRFDDAKMQKLPLFDSEHFFCDVYCLKPGQTQKVHVHASEEKVYVALDGRPTAILGDERRTLEPGQAVIARVGIAHGLVNESDEDARLLVFMAPRLAGK